MVLSLPDRTKSLTIIMDWYAVIPNSLLMIPAFTSWSIVLGFLAVFRIFCSARNREVSILYLRWLVSVLYTYSFHTCKDFLS